MTTISRKIVAILLAFALVFSISSIAIAKPSEKQKLDQISKREEQMKKYDVMVQKLEPFVKRNMDGTFYLDIPEDADVEENSKEFKTIHQGMRDINKCIKEGRLVSTPNKTVYDPKDNSFSLQDGSNGIHYTWYGADIYLNHYYCNIMFPASGLGGLAYTLRVALGVSVPVSGMLAALFFWEAGMVSYYDRGRGVIFHTSPLCPPMVILWMSSQ